MDVVGDGAGYVMPPEVGAFIPLEVEGGTCAEVFRYAPHGGEVESGYGEAAIEEDGGVAATVDALAEGGVEGEVEFRTAAYRWSIGRHGEVGNLPPIH